MNNTLTLAIIGHLVGDFLLQNDWQAMHKKKNSFRCAIHCILWSFSVCWFAGWSPNIFLLMSVLHFIQDRTNIVLKWMNLIGQQQFATGPCSPWSIIVVDQVWHILTIWTVWHFTA